MRVRRSLCSRGTLQRSIPRVHARSGREMSEGIAVRQETPDDYRQTEWVVREAFWDVYRPGCIEHLVLHKVRTSPSLLKSLALVACDGERIVGALICPRATIRNESGEEFTALSMMVGVLPTYQRRGIGSMLIKRAIETAQTLGLRGIVIFGDPAFYRRLGFRNASEFGIQTADGENFEAFMALELSTDSLKGVQGRFFEDPLFQPPADNSELESFEKEFRDKNDARAAGPGKDGIAGSR